MKNILVISALIIVFSLSIFAQEKESCPKISVTGSEEIQAGEPMIFTVNVEANDLKAISYQWTISAGTIILGQGTPVIQVDTTALNGQRITATVETKGLPEGCQDKQSEVGTVAIGCRLPITIDEYGKLPFREEKARLGNVALALQGQFKDGMALFIVYYTKNDNIQILKTRIGNIVKYLTETHKIPKERIGFVFSQGTEYRTKIYLPPSDAFQDLRWEESLNNLKPQTQLSKKTAKKTLKRN